MIDFSSNINAIMLTLSANLQLIDTDRMTQEMATTAAGMMHMRIHEQGKASDGSKIGTYSAGYMKVRTGDYKNGGKVSKGKNKGKTKDAGTVSRGANKGSARPQYHRDSSIDVILSLTRELENDWGADKCFEVPGGWAVGFVRNPNRSKKKSFTHTDIAMNAERIYGKHIFSLSKEEKDVSDKIVERYIQEAIK